MVNRNRFLAFALCFSSIVCVAFAQPTLIPAPQSLHMAAGTFEVPDIVEVAYGAAQLSPAADYLVESLRQEAALQAQAQRGKAGTIVLSLEKRGASGAYRLAITREGIRLTGADPSAMTNGIATLRQLFLQYGRQLPILTIDDSPRFSWRGFHLDVSRHFFTVPEVKRIIDLMSLYKLNRFHWHLTDDQGWRIEIKKYPLLTERGAWRIYNDQDTACMRQAVLTDDPSMLVPRDAERMRIVATDTLYGGFYTQEQIRDIVAYARQRGIETIPEIDMPGHFLSAIENYDGISCFPQVGWGEFFTTPLCPGKDKTLAFCRDVWDEVISLFPFEYVHVGGDEVLKDNWKRCPDCQQRIRDQHLKNEFELQAWFIHQMETYLNRHGRKMMGWDEILEGGLSRTATVTWWRTWVPEAPVEVTAQGNDVIFCPGAPMYFSQKEQKGNIRDVYDYDLQPTGMTAAQLRHIRGVQGNLWCEYIPTLDRAFYQYFPRIMALSELAWTQPSRKDYDDFVRRMTCHFDFLHRLGISYHTPSLDGFYGVNAFTSQGTLNATCADPSAVIRYTTDGTLPTTSSPRYTGPVTVDESTDFSIRIFQPDGRGGETVRAAFIKQGYLEALASTPAALENGLRATWYDFRAFKCDTMHRCPVRAVYPVDDVVIPSAVRGHIGLIISGYLVVPVDGVYTFALKSDDGSLLKIDGNMVVDNDQPQSPHEEIGQQALRAGVHKIEVRYYDHNGGMLRLNVLDPDGRLMPPSAIYRRASEEGSNFE